MTYNPDPEFLAKSVSSASSVLFKRVKMYSLAPV